MSNHEKRTIVSLVTGVLILAAYLIYTFGKVQSGTVNPQDIQFWASSMLIFIGIGIIAAIILQIIFHILLSIAITIQEKVQNNSCDEGKISKTIEIETTEDEMVKLIELKSMRIGFVVAGIGFITSLILLVVGYSSVIMLNIMFLSFGVGSLVEGITQLYYYRKGVRNV